jgi:twitching motility protein PilJ
MNVLNNLLKLQSFSPITFPSATATPRVGRLGKLPRLKLPKLESGSVKKLLSALIVASMIGGVVLTVLHTRETSLQTASTFTSEKISFNLLRIAKNVQQAAIGTPSAFESLRESRDEIARDLKLLQEGGERDSMTVAPASSELLPMVKNLSARWPATAANVDLILAQGNNLIGLGALEETIRNTPSQLGMLAQKVAVQAQFAREPYATQTYSKQLLADISNFNFGETSVLLSTDQPNPQIALNFAENVRRYHATLKELTGAEPSKKGIQPLRDTGALQSAQELQNLISPFAAAVQSITENMTPLSLAKQAARDVSESTDGMLRISDQLAAAYGRQQAGVPLFLVGAAACALILLISLVALDKLLVADARKRAQESEEQNRRNQEAILRLLDEMGKLADGDLTVQAKVTEDVTGAIADSINFTIEQVRGLVSGITRAADQVTHATGNAQKIATQLLAASQKQSTEIQTTGHSVLQIAQSINQVSDNATQSAKVAQNSLSAAEKGSQAVQNAIRGMDEIREQIQETSKRIKRLGESSQEIGEIVQLITGITEQTNVLALNAAIQAASAGEAGRGFAVVAEEVQRLAERSAEATKHITEIVKSIQQDTQNTVEAMERSTQGVVEGARVADEAGQALHEIEEVSTRLAELIGAISNATQEQSKSAARVAASMKGILNITQLTTAGTQKSAQSATELITLATELKHSVSGFKLA